MRILWVNPSFLDYRVPVYAELDRLTGNQLHIVFSNSRTPKRVADRIRAAIGVRAIAMEGERSIGLQREDTQFANSGIRIPYQPGLLRRVMRTPADVVIAEGFFQWTPAAMAKCLRQRVPLVISYERTAHTERNCPRWRTLYRKAVLRISDAMVCNGSLSREYAIGLGMRPDRITTGQMVPDTAFEANRAKCGSIEREIFRRQLGIQGVCFLYVGSLTARKGIRELAAAWVNFSKTATTFATLLIAGDGPEREFLKNRPRDAGWTSTKYLGPVSYDTLPRIYSAADVFVSPTLEDNWSLVVPEAMACGLPVLCSKYNGCWPELVRDNVNGWVFDPLDRMQLSGLLQRCCEASDRLSDMGLRSHQIVGQFTPQSAAQSIFHACELAVRGH